MSEPQIGQRVLLVSPAYGGETRPGQIVSVAFTGLCTVKQDQGGYRAVTGVKYYAEPSDFVDGRYWQVCYPDPDCQEDSDASPVCHTLDFPGLRKEENAKVPQVQE